MTDTDRNETDMDQIRHEALKAIAEHKAEVRSAIVALRDISTALPGMLAFYAFRTACYLEVDIARDAQIVAEEDLQKTLEVLDVLAHEESARVARRVRAAEAQ